MLKTFSIFVQSSQGDLNIDESVLLLSLSGNLENSLTQGCSRQHSPLVLSYIVFDI